MLPSKQKLNQTTDVVVQYRIAAALSIRRTGEEQQL
jgi:hypothetical protein